MLQTEHGKIRGGFEIGGVNADGESKTSMEIDSPHYG
jgi:hypothetical protein